MFHKPKNVLLPSAVAVEVPHAEQAQLILFNEVGVGQIMLFIMRRVISEAG